MGQVEDATSELTYLNARYYDPTVGRFISPDPLMYPSNALTLDPYVHAANNPILFQDASGMCCGLTGKEMAACGQGLANSVGFFNAAKQQANLSKAKSIPIKPRERSHAWRAKVGPDPSKVKARADKDAAQAQLKKAKAQAVCDWEYSGMLNTAKNQAFVKPAPVGGVPQVSRMQCWNYDCQVQRDSHNVSIMSASPSDYCTFAGRNAFGGPITASCNSNGAGAQLFTDGNGKVRKGSTWDTLAAGDQDRIFGASTVPMGTPKGAVTSASKTATKVDFEADGLDPYPGEGLDSYGGGSYTSPGWVPGGGTSVVGGSEHHCLSSYSISAHDASGLSQAQITAVIAYNQC